MLPALVPALIGVALTVPPASPPSPDPARLAAIRDAALQGDWAWQKLLELSDVVGPRLSGSPGQAAAETWLAAAMRAAGARVTLQPVSVPRWERGEERAALVAWAGRPEGVERRLALTALGGSGATPAAGLTAPVLVVRDLDELGRRAPEARGAVVVFTERFDQRLAEAGRAGAAYGLASRARFNGPARAAELGAVAALVRSVGGAVYRLPHTGLTRWKQGQVPIPAGALASEDADLLERLAARGPVRLRLTLTPRTLPDAPAHNVLADLPGREAPEQVVLISGHLDSWDLGDGAQDDGAPTVAAFAAVELLSRLGLQPRRTIRAVAFANEENGSRGAQGYLAEARQRIGDQVAALESDAGAGHPFGLAAAMPPAGKALLQPAMTALAPLGVTVLELRGAGEHCGADIGGLQELGVPCLAPLVDTRHYFDVHHSPADTVDKVDPEALRRHVAMLAVLAWVLSEGEPLPRWPAAGK